MRIITYPNFRLLSECGEELEQNRTFRGTFELRNFSNRSHFFTKRTLKAF